MEKRYQVFISSTFEDLREERKEIIEILLNAKYVPSGMEMFSASNEDQFKYIKKIIDNCDYYVLILGGRYGSMNEGSGKSFTEMEYEYAMHKEIPILAFVHNDPDNLPSNKRENENVELFKEFRKKVLSNSKMCKMWSSKSELVSNVVVSLIQIVDEYPRIGWVRGEQDTTDLLAQINKLRIENEKLLKDNQLLLQKDYSYQVDADLASGDDEFTIIGETYELGEEYDPDFGEYVSVEKDNEWIEINLTWDILFKHIAPEIFNGSKEHEFLQAINSCIKDEISLKNFNVSKQSYNIMKYQLLALGLIEITGDIEEEYISLTEKGKKEFMNIITIKRK